MNKKNNTLEIQLDAERKLLKPQGGSTRHIVATLTPPELNTAIAERPPQNVAIVIDRSGSMGGGRLASAKQAVIEVANMLGAEDRLSVAAFDQDTMTVLRSTAMDVEGRSLAEREVGRLECGGSTNLFAGFLLGSELVAEAMNADSAGINRVILLSDGHANQGELNPSVIAQHARALSDRGIITSTVGIGDGYESRFLQALSEAGGGDMHDAEKPQEIVEVILGEMTGAVMQCATGGEFTLRVQHCTRVEQIGIEPGQSRPLPDGACEVTVRTGALFRSRQRKLVFAAHFSPGDIGEKPTASVNLALSGADDIDVGPLPKPLRFKFAPLSDVHAEPNRVEAAGPAARALRDVIQREATQLNRMGDANGIRSLIDRHEDRFRHLVRGLPDEGDLLDDLHTIRRRADQIWDERTRKEMDLSSMMSLKSGADFRSESKTPWKERL